MAINHLFVIFFLYHLVIMPCESWRPYVFEFTNVSTYSFSHVVTINSSIAANGSISIYATIIEQLPNFYGKTVFALESKNGIYDLEVINRTINFCELFKNNKYEPILQIFYKEFLKYGVVPRSCPIPRKLYYMKNVVIDTERLPPVFPTKKAMVDVNVLSKYGTKLKPILRYVLHFQIKEINKS